MPLSACQSRGEHDGEAKRLRCEKPKWRQHTTDASERNTQTIESVTRECGLDPVMKQSLQRSRKGRFRW